MSVILESERPGSNTVREELYVNELLNFSPSNEYVKIALAETEGFSSGELNNNLTTGKAYVTENGEKRLDIMPTLIRHWKSKPEDKFIAIQKWEGHILEIDKKKDKVIAQLIDLTHGGEEEEGEFSLSDDFSLSDQQLLQPGAIFYWTIGHETKDGTRQKASIIKLRRVPLLDTDDILDMRQQSLELKKNIKWV